MYHLHRFYRSGRFGLVLLGACLMLACGGGSGPGGTVEDSTAGGGIDTDPPGGGAGTAPKTATVAVLLTDAPGQRWDQAFATITSIELIGGANRQTLFSGRETIDLLSLPDYYEVFAIADDIPPGSYEKIRLQLESLELVDLDDQGAVIERVQAQLVGNGKLDLNPRGRFFVAAGDTLFVEIDFDMHKAFKTTRTGNGRVIVRPVVMVNITRQEPPGRLTRLHGFINSLDTDAQRFVLCQSQLAASPHDRGRKHDHDGRQRNCIGVATDELTGLFGSDGLPIVQGDLLVNDEVTAIGRLRRKARGDDDDDDVAELRDHDGKSHKWYRRLQLHAVTVERGEDFIRVAGTADTAVNGDSFDLALAAGQRLGTDQPVLSTQLFEKTRIFSKEGKELDPTAIVPGIGVLADGVLVPGEGVPDLLRSALLILDLDIEHPEQVLRGHILAVNFDAATLQLWVGDHEVCVDAAGADIFLITNSDGLLSVRGTLGDLVPGQSADVFGTGETGDGCFAATDLLVDADADNALPIAAAGPDQTVPAGANVALDGSLSSDADGDPLSYAWELVLRPDGSMAELVGADTALPSFTADQPGEYVIELTLNDGTADSAPDSVTVTATPLET